MNSETNSIPTILVVDDDPDILEFINKIVRTQKIKDINFIFASTGAGAISLINSQHVDAIVLDIKLPDITGIMVAEKVRESMPNIPIAIFTSYDGDNIKEKIIEVNAFYWYKLEIMANPRRLMNCFYELLKGKSCVETTIMEELKEMGKDQTKRLINLPFPSYCKKRLEIIG